MLKRAAAAFVKATKVRLPERRLLPNQSAAKVRACLQEQCCKDCVCIGNFSNLLVMELKSPAGEGCYAEYVRVFHNDKAEKLEIIMQLYGSTRTVNRPLDEPLVMSLERIKTNIKNANAKLNKKFAKKLKKDSGSVRINPITDNEPTAELLDHEGEKIKEDVRNKDAWNKASALKICDLTYKVVFDPPEVESVELISFPLVGMPVHPQIQLRKATVDSSRFSWYRKLIKESNDAELMDTDDNTTSRPDETSKSNTRRKHRKRDDRLDEEVAASGSNEDEGWELVGNDKTYTSTEEDVGYSLRLKVHPGNERYPADAPENSFHAASATASTEGNVIMGPNRCFFDDRIALTKDRCKTGSFRMVSYNILADVYASTEYAHDFLFPYCPDEAMDIGYRQQLVIKELTGYNSDIVCLQEVDRTVFESYLMPAMSLEGYAGAFAAKDAIKEGVALFYRRDKFKLVMVDNIILRKAVKEERNEDLYSKISQSDDFQKSLMARGTCILVALLQSLEDTTKRLLVGNTHLYWHPRGGQVRLIQMEIALREMRRLRAEYAEIEKGCTREVPCIITGDFNSHPKSGVIQLLAEGTVPAHHVDWFTMGKLEHLEGMNLDNPMILESACGYPAYTNFVAGFHGCLDYIFVDPKFFQVSRVIPQPTHKEVTQYTALPNRTAPSDHIAQVVELAWNPVDPASGVDAPP